MAHDPTDDRPERAPANRKRPQPPALVPERITLWTLEAAMAAWIDELRREAGAETTTPGG